MIEERQRAKPRARATWLVMQLHSWGSPRKTMEQRKVTTSDKSSEKLNRASLAFTRGVPMFTRNTTWKKKNSETRHLTCHNKRICWHQQEVHFFYPAWVSPRQRWWPELRRPRWRWEWSPVALQRPGTRWFLVYTCRELHWTSRRHCTGYTHEHLSQREVGIEGVFT